MWYLAGRRPIRRFDIDGQPSCVRGGHRDAVDGATQSVVRPDAGGFTAFAMLPDRWRLAIASTDATVIVEPIYASDLDRLAERRITCEFSAEDLAPFAHLLDR